MFISRERSLSYSVLYSCYPLLSRDLRLPTRGDGTSGYPLIGISVYWPKAIEQAVLFTVLQDRCVKLKLYSISDHFSPSWILVDPSEGCFYTPVFLPRRRLHKGPRRKLEGPERSPRRRYVALGRENEFTGYIFLGSPGR